MSILEELRTPRDFPAAGLRVPLTSLESTNLEPLKEWMDARFKEIEKRLEQAERMASERHGWALEAIARLAEIGELRERVVRMEERQPR